MKRTRILSLELSQGLPDLGSLDGCSEVLALLRWNGRPLGSLTLPVQEGSCPSLAEKVVDDFLQSILEEWLRTALRAPAPSGWDLEALCAQPAPEIAGELPTVSLAVCTRDRSASLKQCLEAIGNLSHRPTEILVVDNAPRTTATRDLVAQHFTGVRYIVEPRPGLDWARNRAIAEARGEIIAFTDDDVMVDAGYIKALAAVFAENPWVMAVTGLVMPYELETDAQRFFEECGGFGRGCERKWYRALSSDKIGWKHGGAGKFGTGANMAFRRCVFERIGGFDPALDVGTVTQGGGDLEMFFRVLKSGHSLVYEPAAVVWHQHRRDYNALKAQIASNGIGFLSYVVRSVNAYPSEFFGFLRLCWYFFWWWNLRRIARSLIRPGIVPRELFWAEFRGSIVGLLRYPKALRTAAQIQRQLGRISPELPGAMDLRALGKHAAGCATAVRAIDLKTEGARDLVDVSNYRAVRVYVLWGGTPLGEVTIDNLFRPVGAGELADHIVKQFTLPLLRAGRTEPASALLTDAQALVRRHLRLPSQPQPRPVINTSAVSVIVATYDRPKQLRECLQRLNAQQTRHSVEIVVVDNHPESGLTQSVAAEFPNAIVVNESRAGLSYARNAGIRASRGEILVTTDDDVTMPADWLEKLIAPFARADVMLVTGAVFPVELETRAQQQFEFYGGLGRGFERREFGRGWFDSFRRRAIPTWEIGATANAAVRACALSHQDIGLLDEALGAGSPTGCGEDTYLFYRVLKAGFTIIYEPAAYVWHRHRREDRALRRQIYNYSKGHSAYHLTTLFKDRDLRAATRLLAELPLFFLGFLKHWLCREPEYPLSLLLPQVAGYITGPLALWRSRRRVKRLGSTHEAKGV